MTGKIELIKAVSSELTTQEKLFNSFCYPCRLKITRYTARRGFTGLPENISDEKLLKRVKEMEQCAKHFPKLLCGPCKALHKADRAGASK